MGNYNPHAPIILGQEWVPIREENPSLSPVVNVVEQGHGFTLNQARVIQDGRFYLNTFPEDDSSITQPYEIAVYPRGFESLTGPVRTIDIPVNNGGITGNAILTGASIADALWEAADGNFITLSGGTPLTANLDLYFATNTYAQLLNGKRILKVEMIYSGERATVNPLFNCEVTVNQVPNPNGVSYGTFINDAIVMPESSGSSPGPTVFPRIDMGEITPFWQTADLNLTTERLPWTYSILQRFEITAANRLTFRWNCFDNANGAIFLTYCAMRVTFCEEQRLIVGATQYGAFQSLSVGHGGVTTHNFTNVVVMRSLPTFAANPVLLPGDYSVVLSAPDAGIPRIKNSPYAILNALRELYEIPSHPGVQVNLTTTLGDTFTQEDIVILPQLSLHTTGGAPLVEPHVYGRQAVAQVYSTVTATQEVLDSAAGGATTWPQVRFYARRFGNTTVPLLLSSPTITASSVQITPPAFDALDELIDGWKEVTLRFVTPPTMGAGTTPQWRWSAAGELIANRWEILGVTAPALTGSAGTLITQVPSIQTLSAATYGQPASGATVNLGWVPGYSPFVTGTTDDPTADATIIFSQDPTTITGVAVSLQSQPITGFVECGHGPCCIPSAISYNQITWPYRVTSSLYDTFTRSSASTWGVATSTQTWVHSGGVSGDYTVNGTSGVVTITVANSSRSGDIAVTMLDVDGYGQISMTTTPTVAMTFGALTWHKTSAVNDMYAGEIDFMPDGSVVLAIRKWVFGVDTVLATKTVGFGYVLGTKFNIRIKQRGISIQARAWVDGDVEPSFWQLMVVDSDLTTAGSVGTRSRIDTGGGTPQIVLYDNVTFTSPNFGVFELQRMDPVDTAWQTIMRATSSLIASFNDYEARVGLTSSYRIRQTNVLNFAGAWSTTVTGAIAEPGTTMPSCGTNKRGVLIFTSNEIQSGLGNLAYAMTWTDSIEESFSYPEASAVELNQFFDRDYQVAFHGTERGGEAFTRTLLLANAAVALPRLANMHSLRDLAWDDLAYICVRDDIGDRWLASVIVPSGSIRRNRRLYNASISIIEVTATPTPVNP